MKVILNFSRALAGRLALLGGVLAIGVLAPVERAAAYVYYTHDALVEAFFGAATVESVTWAPSPAQRAEAEAELGYALPERTWEILVGREGGVATSWAILDAQRGQHEPIDFAVQVGADGTVGRVEILVYREPYGDGVRAPAFRKQFVGLGPASPMRVGKEIQIVSGSTISTRALAIGVRRAAVLLATWRAGA